MTRFLAALILGATMTLATAAAFAEIAEHESSRQLIEQPVAIPLDVTVVPGAPDQQDRISHDRR